MLLEQQYLLQYMHVSSMQNCDLQLRWCAVQIRFEFFLELLHKDIDKIKADIHLTDDNRKAKESYDLIENYHMYLQSVQIQLTAILQRVDQLMQGCQ